MGLFESRDERERRFRAQEEKRRCEEELRSKEREAEVQRLAAKQGQVWPIIARARAQEYFLDPEYCKRYAYEHKEEVLQYMAPEIPEQEKWLMDADFLQGRICDPKDVKLAQSVWNAKKKLVRDAGALTTAEIRSWQLKEFKEFEAAANLKMSVSEYREREVVLPEALASLRQRFDKMVVFVFEGDDESRRMGRDMIAQDQGLASWQELEKKVNESRPPGEKEKTQAEMIESQPWMAIAMVGGVLDERLISKISGRGVENVRKMEAVYVLMGLAVSRQNKIFATDNEFADYLVDLERKLHASASSRIDLVVQSYEKDYPPDWSKWKITAPWKEWGAEWKDRLGRPRTREQFLSLMEESKVVAMDIQREIETMKAQQEKGKTDGK